MHNACHISLNLSNATEKVESEEKCDLAVKAMVKTHTKVTVITQTTLLTSSLIAQ
jgi:hypothetical protein